MKNNTKFALSTVAGLGFAAFAAMPAFAADVVYEEPPAPAAPMVTAPVSSWAGPYAGEPFSRELPLLLLVRPLSHSSGAATTMTTTTPRVVKRGPP